MIIYDSCDIYINSATTNSARIVALDAVITALLATATTAAVDENLTEYILDDGQTKIQCNYRGVDAIMRSIQSLEKIKQMYMNQLNGRVVRLVDSKSFSSLNWNNGR
jgi:hypothetical protein